jgi:hypothetical protein
VKARCTNKNNKGKGCDESIDTLIERFKKIRALNCTDPYDVGLDGYVWKKFMVTTRSHLFARMF